MKDTKKLYRVTLRGMRASTGVIYGVSYVVADDSEAAYRAVKKYLDMNDIGFKRDRILASIELLAESGEFPDCSTMLYLPESQD